MEIFIIRIEELPPLGLLHEGAELFCAYQENNMFGITSRTLLRASARSCDVRVILAAANKAQAEGIGLCVFYHVGINGRGLK